MHEFATSPAAVSFQEDEVRVEDWLIQPVAADTVADVPTEDAVGEARTTTTRTITGPEVVGSEPGIARAPPATTTS